MTQPNHQRRILITCGSAHALHDGLVDMLYVLLPVLAQSFGLNYAQVGMIRAANKAAMAMFQIPAGLMAERLGERNLLAFGTLCTGLSFIALGLPLGGGLHRILFNPNHLVHGRVWRGLSTSFMFSPSVQRLSR